MKHRVAVTVSEPDHPSVTMRKEQKQKFVRVTAESQDEAITKAKAHYKKQGYKVHGAEYHSEIKEEVEQIDEISKKTLGSYVKKASLDAMSQGVHAGAMAQRGEKGDSEKFNKSFNKGSKRLRGIDKATDRLTKEELELDEMTQGKEYSHKQIMDKVKSGNWEAVTDIKPGKTVEMRHHTGKRVTVRVKHEISEAAEQIDELSKATLSSYAKKAEAEADKESKASVAAWEKGDNEASSKHFKKMSARSGGAGLAAHKASLKEEELELEEAEQVDELNRSTVRSYLYKAQDTLKAAAKTHPTMVKKRVAGSMKAIDRLKKEELEMSEERKSDPVPSVYSLAPESETRGTYHVHYHGTDKDGNKTTKVYKLKANTNHHAQSKAMKIARSEFPHHERAGCTTEKFFKEEISSFASYSEACDCSKVPAIKNAVKKLRQESIEVEEIEEELEDLQEASFSYCVKKAEEAKSKGNNKRFEYHMENARTARLGMTGKEMIRNRQHLDKYNELRNGK